MFKGDRGGLAEKTTTGHGPVRKSFLTGDPSDTPAREDAYEAKSKE